MKRRVEPEWLDRLPPEHPQARESRRDLDRLNAWMGNPRQMAAALRNVLPSDGPAGLVELGAGDGRFALRMVQALPGTWRGRDLLLLDRQNSVSEETCTRLRDLAWRVETVQADVFAWLEDRPRGAWGTIIANLFLHHFVEADLRRLLQGVAQRAQVFVAIEPRRSRRALAFSFLVGCIGCRRVTRHDAPVSVRAGFSGGELSGLWPRAEGWILREGPVGWFGHWFAARKQRFV